MSILVVVLVLLPPRDISQLHIDDVWPHGISTFRKRFFATEFFYQINKLPSSHGDQYLQSDERKRIVLLISDQKLPVKKWIRKGFLLLPSNFLGAPTRHAEVQT
jgi:hypothetical protein